MHTQTAKIELFRHDDTALIKCSRTFQTVLISQASHALFFVTLHLKKDEELEMIYLFHLWV